MPTASKHVEHIKLFNIIRRRPRLRRAWEGREAYKALLDHIRKTSVTPEQRDARLKAAYKERQEKLRRAKWLADKPKRDAKRAAKKRETLKKNPFMRWSHSLHHRARKPGTKVASTAELQNLWNSQYGICALTGVNIAVHTARLDHKIPISKGGGHTIDNLQFVTHTANQMKHSLTEDELVCASVLFLERRGYIITHETWWHTEQAMRIRKEQRHAV